MTAQKTGGTFAEKAEESPVFTAFETNPDTDEKLNPS